MTTETTDRQLVTIVLLVLGVLIVLPMFFMGFGMMGGPMMGGWDHGMWGNGNAVPGWFVLVWVAMRLVFLAALVGVGYLVFRAVTGDAGTNDRAMEELRVAYARGDLSEEEYERRREALQRES